MPNNPRIKEFELLAPMQKQLQVEARERLVNNQSLRVYVTPENFDCILDAFEYEKRTIVLRRERNQSYIYVAIGGGVLVVTSDIKLKELQYYWE